jgi:acetylornithine deacetylase/succinyl-diaminopimelate desuccinylase-like protein
MLAVLLLSSLSAAAADFPSDAIPQPRHDQYADLAVRWMQEYLRVDTTNPPGNEARAAEFFRRIFEQEGIEHRIFEFAPGRANLWARLKGSGAKRPLILLNHTDVVSSDPARWKAPPFSGEMVEGAMYGRGALDMKNLGLAQLLVLVMLKREQVALDRDVIFLATADEEAGGEGTDWMIAHQRELLGNAEFMINEGGSTRMEDGKVKQVGVAVGEKAAFWLKVTARGQAGHGSRPIADSAPNRLVRALDRILRHPSELKLLPVVEEYMREMARFEPAERAVKFRNPRQALRDKRFRAEMERDYYLGPMLRNTISLTMLGGSQQTNVIPGEAWAHLDVRLLPGEDPEAFLAELQRVINDANVSVKPQQQPFLIANESPINTALYAAIRGAAGRYFPDAALAPRISTGYTECQRYRPLGMACYGFAVHAATSEESSTAHGDNERIRVEEVRRGPRILYDVVVEVAGAARP